MDRQPQATLLRARKPTPLDLRVPSAPRLAYEDPDCCIYLDSSAELVQVQSPLRTPPWDLTGSLSSVSLGKISDGHLPDTGSVLPDAFDDDEQSPRLLPRSLDVERVAFHELSEIHSLIKLKSEQITEKERALQQSSCAVAELMGLATARLQAEAERLLQSANRDLQRKATAQRRRLEQLLKKTQEEFRKVVTWRREVRAGRDSVAAEAEEHQRVLQRLQDAQRRCTTLSDREKEQRQTLLEERAKWDKERQRYESQHQQLRQEVQELRLQARHLSSAIAQTTDAALRSSTLSTSDGTLAVETPKPSQLSPSREGRTRERSASARGRRSRRYKTAGAQSDPNHSSAWQDTESDERSTSCPSKHQSRYSRLSACNPSHSAPEVTGIRDEDAWLPLMGAWWGLDMVLITGRRSLWGYVVFLSEVMNACCADSNPVLRDLGACFLRRWSWRLLVDDARTALHSASLKGTAAPYNLEASARPAADVQHNALEWARQRRTCIRNGNLARRELSHQREGSLHAPEATPFDLSRWLPAPDGPLAALHGYISPKLLLDAAPGVAKSSTCRAGLLVLEPAAAQQQLASGLWHDARKQLMEMEEPMREGGATEGSLAEVGRALLSAAALALGTGAEVMSARAALRALVHLCEGHAAALRQGLCEGLPVLLLLVSTADHQAAAAAADEDSVLEGSVYAEIAETAASLLARLSVDFNVSGAWVSQVDSHAEFAGLAAAALLRMSPTSAAAEPLAQLLAGHVARPGAAAQPERLSCVVGLHPQLRQWLERCRSSRGASASSSLIEHLEQILEAR